jgi:glycosyltransferase involved in cell wall biosynthesis
MNLRHRSLRVLLLRDIPELGLRSMERYADALEAGFAECPSIETHSTTVHLPPAAVRLRLRRPVARAMRFLGYPLTARRQRGYDLYHIVDHGMAHLAAALPAARTIVTCHDLMLLRSEEGVTGFRADRWTVARFRWNVSQLRRVAHVVCPTASTRNDVERLVGVPRERITVVPHGIDPSFRPLDAAAARRARATLGLPGRYALLHVSSGSAYKNVPATLRVTAALRRAGLDVTLVRTGRGLNAAERLLAAGLELDGAIVERGRPADGELALLYNACDALLFPSFYEGFGWPPLEAMACGLPVVVSDCAALTEVTGDAALRAGAEDIDGLAAAVAGILQSADVAADLRRRGLDRAAEFFWERSIERLARIYSRVAAGA